MEDLILFVADVPNNGQDVLDVLITKPNRERQKLMREQNILAQVILHILSFELWYQESSCISFLLMYNKLPQNLVSEASRYLGFLWIRNLGVV